MANEKHVVRGKMEVAGIMGPVWMIGWLFTVGYAHLPVGKAIVGLLIWPYYLGTFLSRG